EPFSHLGHEVLPAGVAVLARDHELRVALRQRQVDIRQMRARTRYRNGVTRGDVARELLCLFTERLERRTSRERFRCGHGDLLSCTACARCLQDEKRRSRVLLRPHMTYRS